MMASFPSAAFAAHSFPSSRTPHHPQSSSCHSLLAGLPFLLILFAVFFFLRHLPAAISLEKRTDVQVNSQTTTRTHRHTHRTHLFFVSWALTCASRQRPASCAVFHLPSPPVGCVRTSSYHTRFVLPCHRIHRPPFSVSFPFNFPLYGPPMAQGTPPSAWYASEPSNPSTLCGEAKQSAIPPYPLPNAEPLVVVTGPGRGWRCVGAAARRPAGVRVIWWSWRRRGAALVAGSAHLLQRACVPTAASHHATGPRDGPPAVESSSCWMTGRKR